MTLSNQLDAASSSRKSTKKNNRQQKQASTTTPPPKDDIKSNTSSKQSKSSGTNDKKDALSALSRSQDSLLRRSFSIRKQLSNLVSSGSSSLKRSLSFGKGVNELTLKKPWSASLHSLREDVPSTEEDAPALRPDGRGNGSSVFDSRKLVTRTQSLLVQSTRTDAKKYKGPSGPRKRTVSSNGPRHGSSNIYHGSENSLDVDVPDFCSQSLLSLPYLLTQSHEAPDRRYHRLYSRDEKRVATKNVSTNITLRRQKAFKNEITSAAIARSGLGLKTCPKVTPATTRRRGSASSAAAGSRDISPSGNGGSTPVAASGQHGGGSGSSGNNTPWATSQLPHEWRRLVGSIRRRVRGKTPSTAAAAAAPSSEKMSAFMTSSDPAVRDDFLRATMRIFLVVSPPMGRLQMTNRGRSRSLTHLDCLDSNDLTPDVNMTTDTADRLIVPCTEQPRVRRHKLARSQVSSSEYFSVNFECGLLAAGGDDHSISSEEFLPATKGMSLSEALKPVCARRGVDLTSLDVFLENSKTPLSVLTDTSWLGGKQLQLRACSCDPVCGFVVARDDRSSARGLVKPSNSQVPLRKTSGSYRGSSSGRFFSASTEDPNYLAETSHEGSFKGSKGPKQRWSGLFGNNKDTKMESLVEQLNYYSKHGIPQQQQQAEDDNDEGLYDLEDDWQSVVTSAGDLSEKHRQQQTAIWELLSTEIAYIRTLRVITNLFLACLCNLQAVNILNDVDKARLFSNIPDIYAANKHFWCQHLLPMLAESRKTCQPLNPQLLLDGFHRFQDIFLPYTKYCAEQAQCQHYCRERHQENEVFTAYLVWCETQKDCNRLRLMDIVVQPMQRLTKYSLLLKAIHRNTENEEHRDSLATMIKCVDQFVNDVNSTLRQRQDHERLKGIIARIESYDVVESKDDDVERLLKLHSELDLTCPMPGCHVTQRRHLLLESDLKLKDNSTSKMDVHCFLLTDVLLVCKAATKKGGVGVRVVRQPYMVDRLIVQELSRDSPSIALVYLNEFRTATAAFVLSSSESKLIKNWVDGIRKAQELYTAAKQASSAANIAAASSIPVTTTVGSISRQPSSCFYEDDDMMDQMECQSCASYGTNTGLIPSRSPRGGSSRGSRGSSLVHSHSGSMDMNEVSSVSSVSQSRGVSMENELRGSSISSDEGIPAMTTCSCSEGKAVTQQPVPTPSPRPDRRSLLSKTPSPNTLSVQVPVFSNLGQSLPNLNLATSPNTSHPSAPNPPTSLLLVPPSGKTSASTSHHHGGLLSPGHRGVSYPPPSPPRGSLRRGFALTQSRNPPLQKTRHVNSSTASSGVPTVTSPTQGPSPAASFDFDVPVIAGISPPSEERVTPEPPEGAASTGPLRSHPHRHAMMKRLTRTDNRRYHTAGAIDDLKKQDSRDASIHKRLSWNCGPGMQGSSPASSDLPATKYVSNESMQSSSGVSSTGSVLYGDSLVGELDLLEPDGQSLRIVCGNQAGCCFDTLLSEATSVSSTAMDEAETSACPPLSPAMEAINMELIRSHLSPGTPAPSDPGGSGTSKVEVREPQDGATRSPPSKADLLKMKDLILTDSSVEASQV